MLKVYFIFFCQTRETSKFVRHKYSVDCLFYFLSIFFEYFCLVLIFLLFVCLPFLFT